MSTTYNARDEANSIPGCPFGFPAQRYILDPLTAPEPSQLDGPGSSFFNPRRSLSLNYKLEDIPIHPQRRHSSYPTPPRLISPPRPAVPIYHPKPLSPGRRHSYLPPTEWVPAEVVLGRSQSLTTSSQRPSFLGRSQSLTSSIQWPNFADFALPDPDSSNKIKGSASQDKQGVHHDTQRGQKTQNVQPAQITQSGQGKPEAPDPRDAQSSQKPRSVATTSSIGPDPKPEKAASSPRPDKVRVGRKPPQTHYTQGTAEILSEILSDKTSSFINRIFPLRDSATSADNTVPTLRRTGSLTQKLADNMSSYGASERTGPDRRPSERKHHSRKSSRPYTDTIDSLDRVGGLYHHGGPFDATLAAVNKHKKTSPLEAVKDTNMEALKATPREYIEDSLRKHVPLQGTATIPPGMPDMNGNIMRYREGADLMRESDAPGGAYRRWDFIPYDPEDLKGKGEPSYTIEKAFKEKEPSRRARRHSSSFGHGTTTVAYEMQNRTNQPPPVPPKDAGVSVRRRSFSHATTSGASPWMSTSDRLDPKGSSFGRGGLGRSDSTSKRITDGIKRRFGSLRRK
ncbi:Pal1 cell morphology [Niveomyces insectorum RCEF 264]|uniref:Pal1 cell morphology n=1 Tax=Niveomyces insectorum RCEF 264 TaxID=1081102 RepID=A0A162MEY6_9HYPO|nr:Pal1 cell morphology [Niveomyces insectorum RCEF 264]